MLKSTEDRREELSNRRFAALGVSSLAEGAANDSKLSENEAAANLQKALESHKVSGERAIEAANAYIELTAKIFDDSRKLKAEAVDAFEKARFVSSKKAKEADDAAAVLSAVLLELAAFEKGNPNDRKI